VPEIKFLMVYVPESQIKYPGSIEINAESSSKKYGTANAAPLILL
jgi:hypothetical protein